MNVSHFLAVLIARRVPAVVVFLLVAIGAVAYTLTMPKSYTATSSLLIDAKPDPVSSMLYGGSTSPAVINTQIEIIRSDRVSLRVIQNLKLTEMADLKEKWAKMAKTEGSMQDWLAGMLQIGLDASVARPGSNVINISYKGAEPRFVAAVANAYMQAYLETAIELRVDPAKQYTGFFNEQVKEARDTLEKAQARVSAYQREKGIISSDDKMDIEMNRLNMLSQELVSVQTLRAESSTRQAQAATNAERMSEVLSSGTVSGLKTDLARAEGRLQELLARYGDNHPQVQDARNAVADLKRRLSSETRNVTGSVVVSANINRAREAEIRASLEAQRAKVMKLKDVHDVENAQRAYDLVFNRLSQTNIESQNKQSNATVISQATPPPYPSSPKVRVNIMMGLIAALGLGLATALVIEQFDQRVRTASDAVSAIGLPVIGIMPTPLMSSRVKGQMALTQQRVISGRRLPAPGKGPS